MTRYKPVVGVSEGITLLFIFISSKIFLTHMIFMIDDGGNASYIIPVLNTLAGLLGVLLLATLLNRHPGRDLVQIGETLTGPYVNTLFSLYYLVFFIVGAGFTLRSVGERVVTGFLPDTPISMVTFALLSGSLVVAYLGLEAVVRIARFLVSVLVISIMALVLLTTPHWQWHVFFPLLGQGPWDILRGAVKTTGNFTEILLLGVIVPFLPGGKAKLVGVWAVLVAGFFMSLLVLVPLLIFTYPTLRELTLPTFEIARIINIGRFGQRMDVLFLPVWVFGNMIFISASLYAGAAVLARLCKLHDLRPFVLSMTVFIVVVAFTAQDVPQVSYWNHRYLIRYSFYILVFILLALLLAARLKGRGKGEQDGRKDERGA